MTYIEIHIKCIELTAGKLTLLKLINDTQRLGLKSAKKYLDDLLSTHRYLPFSICSDDFQIFQNSLSEMGSFDIIVGNERNKQILTLGIGDKDAYIKFLSPHILINISKDAHQSQLLYIEKLLAIMNIEQLEQLFEEYND